LGSKFLGTFKQSAGTTTVNFDSYIAGDMFGGLTILENSLLKVTGSTLSYQLQVSNGGRYEHYSNIAAITYINENPQSISFTGDNGKMIFTKTSKIDSYTKYSIESKISGTGLNNRVVFSNANVNFGLLKSLDEPTFDLTGETIYEFEDATISLTKPVAQRKTWTINVTNLSVSNTNLAFQLFLFGQNNTQGETAGTGLSDVLNVSNFTTGIKGLGFSPLMQLNFDGDFSDGDQMEIHILDGQAQFDVSMTSFAVGTNQDQNWQIIADKNGSDLYQWILLTILSGTFTDGLNDRNIASKGELTRVFDIPFGAGGVSEHRIFKSLDGTQKGSLAIMGGANVDERQNYIISGLLKNDEDKRGSLFNLTKETDLHVRFVTISSAQSLISDIIKNNGNGSVLRMSNNASQARFGQAALIGNDAQVDGGAIWASAGKLVMTSVLLSSNTAGRDGGAIYLSANASADFFDVQFISNTALRNGGAIYASNGQTFAFDRIEFIDNYAAGLGGAIYIDGGNVEIDSQTGGIDFRGNSHGVGKKPNDIYIKSGTLLLKPTNNNITFADGITMDSGIIDIEGRGQFVLGGDNKLSGTVIVRNGSNLLLQSASFDFINGTLSVGPALNDGAISWWRITESQVNMNKNSKVIIQNSAMSGVGDVNHQINVHFSTVVFESSMRFEGNVSQAGVFFARFSSVVFQGEKTEFYNNETNVPIGIDAQGGLVTWNNSYIDFSKTKLIAVGNKVIGSSEEARGGFLYIKDGIDMNFNEIQMSSNSASGSAGAIYIQGIAANKINFLGGSFNWNNSVNNAGAVRIVDKAEVTFNNVIFRGNSANGNGGAISSRDGGIAVIVDSSFYDNLAGANGGAIMIRETTGEPATVTIRADKKNIVFSGNRHNLSGQEGISGDTADEEALTGIANDIYLDGDVYLELETVGGRAIILNGGIAGSGNWVKKRGAGTLVMGGVNDFSADFAIELGQVLLGKNALMSVGKLDVSSAAGFNLINGSMDEVTVSGDNTVIDGTYAIEIDAENKDGDILFTQGFIDLGPRSKLIVKRIGLKAITFEIIKADSGQAGNFDGGIYGAATGNRLNYTYDGGVLTIPEVDFDLSNLSGNANEIAQIFKTDDDGQRALVMVASRFAEMTPTQQTKVANQMSGVILINALAASAQNSANAADILLRRIELANSSLWVNAFTAGFNKQEDKFSVGLFKSAGYWVGLGKDFSFQKLGLNLGLYARASVDNMEQNQDSVNVKSFQAGFYGGQFNEFFDLRFIAGFGQDSFYSKREVEFLGLYPESKFDATDFVYVIDTQIKFKTLLKKDWKVLPFISLTGNQLTNDAFTETNGGALNLEFDSSKYNRLETKVGVRLFATISRFDFNINAYGGYLINGKEPKYNVYFEQSKDSGAMKLEGGKISAFNFGMGSGISYKINNVGLSLSVGVNRYEDGSFGYYGGVEGGYKFGAIFKGKQDIEEEEILTGLSFNKRTQTAKIVIKIDLEEELLKTDISQNIKQTLKTYVGKIKKAKAKKIVVEVYSAQIRDFNNKQLRKLSKIKAKIIYLNLVESGINSKIIKYDGYTTRR
jgi:predicted outer membrane repeat protein